MFDFDFLLDPIKFVGLCWPGIRLYDKQVEILRSVQHNDVTIVHAGNMLGKDFIAGLTAIWFFSSRRPVRIMTSSVDGDQLENILWGEIRKFLQTSVYKLPITYNHLHIRQNRIDAQGRIIKDEFEPESFLVGRVSKRGEGMLGAHVPVGPNNQPRNLMIFDECSGIEDMAYETSTTWAKRLLGIGNPYPCENFFKKADKDGSIESPYPGRMYQKVIKICAEDSPNVKLGMAQKAKNVPITNEELIPGLIGYDEYLKRRKLWDKIRQTVSLDGKFYQGSEILLFPPDWLDRAERIASALVGVKRSARTMGIDCGEGNANSVWTICDALGIMHQLSIKTEDTSDIPGRTIALMREFSVSPENILFDRGGGGKQWADYLRKLGYNVRTVAFGEPAQPENKRSKFVAAKGERREEVERAYVYFNRRAEMYGTLRGLINPGPSVVTDEEGNFVELRDMVSEYSARDSTGKKVERPIGFGIPACYTELRRQLSPIPLLYDPEGRLYLPKKDKKDKESKEVTLKELIGCSPDEADSTALAVFGLISKPAKRQLSVR